MKTRAESKTTSPSADQIKTARARSGMTQTAAAELIHSELRRWQTWEAGTAAMHPGLFELFNIKYRLLATMDKHTRPSAGARAT